MGNDDLVELVRTNEFYLNFKSPRDERVLEAMRQVDRRDFLPELYIQHNQALATSRHATAKDFAYYDKPLQIGFNQTCSQPSLVAFMADLLELKLGQRVLEIGSGCGYSAAIASNLVGENGSVYSIEIVPELAEMAKRNLRGHFGPDYQRRVKIIHGDGKKGLPQEAPFDRIYLTATADPQAFDISPLSSQLNSDGGILLFPMKSPFISGEIDNHDLLKLRYKNGGLIQYTAYGPVGFVPLK